MTTPASPGPVGPLQQNVAFWRAQSDRLERDRQNLNYLLYALLPVMALAWFGVRQLWAPAAAAGLCLGTFGMGLYMISVRREEYAFALKAAQAELQAAQPSHTPSS
jgi:hypothetical protein